MSDFRVVVCGGGVAAVEGMLRLRRFMAGLASITLVAPNEELAYRPVAVREAVGFGSMRRYSLARIARDTGAEWVKDTLAAVEPSDRLVHTGEGRTFGYQGLLIAVGARPVADLDHALTFRDSDARKVYERVVEAVEDEHARRVAFVVPEGPVYPLPAYELALMLAERARTAAIDDLELSVITPEPTPLAAFGERAGEALHGLLRKAGVALYLSSVAYSPGPRRLLLLPAAVELELDRIVAIPRIVGPGISGLPGAGAHGFIPIDAHCTVPGTDGRVFAAGDATAFPVKHGGLGAQQADTAAAAIAHLAGAAAVPPPFRPEIQGKLLTGAAPLYFRARLVDGEGFDSEVFDAAPWPVDDKIVASELAAYLVRTERRGR